MEQIKAADPVLRAERGAEAIDVPRDEPHPRPGVCDRIHALPPRELMELPGRRNHLEQTAGARFRVFGPGLETALTPNDGEGHGLLARIEPGASSFTEHGPDPDPLRCGVRKRGQPERVAEIFGERLGDAQLVPDPPERTHNAAVPDLHHRNAACLRDRSGKAARLYGDDR